MVEGKILVREGSQLFRLLPHRLAWQGPLNQPYVIGSLGCGTRGPEYDGTFNDTIDGVERLTMEYV